MPVAFRGATEMESRVSWKGIRDTFLWLLLLLLIGAITAGGLAARWWAAKDDLLTDLLRQNAAQVFPNCNVSFEAARLIDLSHFEITHFRLQKRGTDADLLQIPRIVVEIDKAILEHHHAIIVREVVAHSPEICLIRDQHQHWNWEDLQIAPPPSSSSPEWTVKNGALRIGFHCETDGQTRFVNCQGIQATLQPESHQRYEFNGIGTAEAFGTLQLAGLLDSITGEWQIRGSAGDVRLGDSLLDLAGRFSPEVQQQVQTLRTTNEAILAQSGLNHFPRTASTVSQSTPRQPASAAAGNNSLLRADLAIQFTAGQPSRDVPLAYQVSGRISHGQVSELLLPVPLYDLEGDFRITPEAVEIHNLRAANGGSTLYINGSAMKFEGAWAKNFLVRASQLRMDERIRSFLWGPLAKFYDLLSPSGSFDLDIGLSQKPHGPLQWAMEKFTVSDCRILCDHFRYPVEKISGEIKQHGTAFEIAMVGQASGHPIHLGGTVDLKNPERDLDLTVDVSSFPLDSALRNALQRPEQQKIRHVLDSLRLTGTARTGHVRIVRGQDTKGKVAICIEGEMDDGTMNYTGFPYELTDLRGRLTYNPLERNTWRFEDLKARHQTAQFTGRGVFDLEQAPGQMILEIAALQTPMDHDLEKATTTARPELQKVWSELGMRGSVDVDRIALYWSPGSKCDVTLDGIHWTNGEFRPQCLPYVWNNVSGTLQWDGQKLRIHSLQGDHSGTYLLVNGAVPDSAYVEIAPRHDIAWRLFLDEKTLHIRRLNPDDEFKRAIPASVASALQAVDLRGALDVSLGIEMVGWTAHPDLVTASWSAWTALKDNLAFAGVPLSQLSGNIAHRGTWDGKNLEIEGYAELESLRALEMSFQKINGPFLLRGNRLTLGQPKLAGNLPEYSPKNPFRQEQIRAALYGGQVTFDIEMTLEKDASKLPYRAEIGVTDVELGEWAREHHFEKLMGKINGVVQASGRGASARATTGQGWIQITPAALYELPVFAQMFTILSFRPAQPGDAAFNYAYSDFTIHDEVFDFSNIELVGDAIRLGGRGTVGYAGEKVGALQLNFYSKANNRIPLVGRLLSAVSDNWIRVQVYGNLPNNPIATIEPRIPYLDDAFSGFMQAVESGQQQRVPPRTIRPPTARAGALPN